MAKEFTRHLSRDSSRGKLGAMLGSRNEATTSDRCDTEASRWATPLSTPSRKRSTTHLPFSDKYGAAPRTAHKYSPIRRSPSARQPRGTADGFQTPVRRRLSPTRQSISARKSRSKWEGFKPDRESTRAATPTMNGVSSLDDLAKDLNDLSDRLSRITDLGSNCSLHRGSPTSPKRMASLGSPVLERTKYNTPLRSRVSASSAREASGSPRAWRTANHADHMTATQKLDSILFKIQSITSPKPAQRTRPAMCSTDIGLGGCTSASAGLEGLRSARRDLGSPGRDTSPWRLKPQSAMAQLASKARIISARHRASSRSRSASPTRLSPRRRSPVRRYSPNSPVRHSRWSPTRSPVGASRLSARKSARSPIRRNFNKSPTRYTSFENHSHTLDVSLERHVNHLRDLKERIERIGRRY